jgi:hypothetical protein
VFTFGIAFVAIFQTEFTVVLGGGGAVTVGEYIVSMLAVCALIAFIPAGFLTGIHSFLNIRKQQQKKFHGAEKTKAAEPNIVTN